MRGPSVPASDRETHRSPSWAGSLGAARLCSWQTATLQSQEGVKRVLTRPPQQPTTDGSMDQWEGHMEITCTSRGAGARMGSTSPEILGQEK